MSDFPTDIYSEPRDLDVDTLANLGPLRRMAGIWQGTRGLDVNPKAEGPRKQAYVERIELQPIDPQIHAFRTTEFRIRIEFNPDGTWTYNGDTVLLIVGLDQPFHHTDRNTLTRIADPTPNPLARG